MSGDPPPQSMEVRVDLKVGDLYRLSFSNALRSMLYGRWVLAMVLIVIIAFSAGLIAPIAPLLEPPLVYALLAGLVYLALVRPYFRSRAFARATMGADPSLAITLAAGGIDIHREHGHSHYDWKAVRHARQTSNLLLIYFDAHRALVIPKRCFASAPQAEAARSLIATNAKFTRKRRDSWP